MRAGRRVQVLVALLPWALALGADLARRGGDLVRLDARHLAYFVASAALGLGFWTTLLAAAARGVARRAFGVVFVVLFTLSAGVQAAFFSLWHTYDCAQADLYTDSVLWPLVASLPLQRAALWLALSGAFVVALVLLRLARRCVMPPRATPWVAGVLLVALPFVRSSYKPVQASTPDLLYFHAVAASYAAQLHLATMPYRTRPQQRHPLEVPALTREPTPARNVLLILQESQRFDATCTEYEAHCTRATQASNRAMPGRLPFLRWHALASSTTLSCLTLWTGLLPSDPLHDLESAPTVFRYAKAAGYHSLYFTSQYLATFENMRQQFQDEPFDQLAVATHLDAHADWDTGARDSLLSDYVIERWNQLPEPFFAIVHYSNQHTPYVSDPAQSPFAEDGAKPYDDPENQRRRNANVVYLSDLAVGRLLEAVQGSALGQRTVIVYTADHGEALGERGMSGHTVTHYEPEIHVPTWVSAPAGTLTDAERANLVARKDAWLTHADLVPTFLDLMGVYDAPELAPYRAKLRGVPLGRPLEAPQALPLTNDSWLWESPHRSWGYVRGSLKLFTLDGREDAQCYDLEHDPDERHELGEAACAELPARMRGLFPSAATAERPYRPLR